jgi:hypothetical protein
MSCAYHFTLRFTGNFQNFDKFFASLKRAAPNVLPIDDINSPNTRIVTFAWTDDSFTCDHYKPTIANLARQQSLTFEFISYRVIA